MNGLRKIYFFNSANIGYADIDLEYNVHLAGDQGAGKSTIATAILFFYYPSGSRNNLGLRKHYEPFYQFYFQKSNSYIVYEVENEHGVYSILLYYQGQTPIWRFIDSPFNLEWLLDSNNEIESEWSKIYAKITANKNYPIEISNRVDNYEKYKSIIYGTYNDTKEPFLKKFAISKGRDYNIISRLIQNVFLNKSIDSEFIKDSIVDSLSHIKQSINLSEYRTFIRSFQKFYDQFKYWGRPIENYNLSLSQLTDLIIKDNLRYSSIKNENSLLWRKLNFSFHSAQQNYALSISEIEHLKNLLSDLNDKLYKLEESYNKSINNLSSNIAVLDDKLKTINEKKVKYNVIHHIIELSEKESFYLDKQKQLTESKAILTNKFVDISDKYQKIIDNLNLSLANYLNENEKKISQFKNETFKKIENLFSDYEKNKNKLNSEFSEKENNIKSKIKTESEILFELNIKLSENKHLKYNDAEISDYKSKIHSNEINLLNTENELRNLENDIESIPVITDKEVKLLENNRNDSIQKLSDQIISNKAEIDKLQLKIDSLRNSLYFWLDENVPDWENHLGKIFGDNILYMDIEKLSPAFTGFINSIFGLNIDLADLNISFTSFDEIKSCIDLKINQNNKLREQITGFEEEYDRKISSLKEAASKSISEKKNKRTEKEIIFSKLKKEIETFKLKIDELEKEATQIRIKNETSLTASINEQNEKICNLDKEIERLESNRKALNEKIKNDFLQRKESLNKDIERYENKINNDSSNKKKDIDDEITSIQEARNRELNDKGVNTNVLNQIDTDLDNINNLLKEINKNRDFVAVYYNDKKEFLDKEIAYINEKKDYQTELQKIESDFNKNKNEIINLQYKYNKEIQVKENQCIILNSELDSYNEFCVSPIGLEKSNLSDNSLIENNLSCIEIISEIKSNANLLTELAISLKKNIIIFKIPFKDEDNVFNFKFPVDDSEYFSFAFELQDFVENNRIENYYKETNRYYHKLLDKIVSDHYDLDIYNKNIRSIINVLNKDYRDNIFVGAIHSIEFRYEESTDPLVVAWNNIFNYIEEYQINDNELDLFEKKKSKSPNQDILQLIDEFNSKLNSNPEKNFISMSELFMLQFKFIENGISSGWREKLENFGSNGTSVLIKAIVNISLLNILKKQSIKNSNELTVHCLIDELNLLSHKNIEGIINYANARNISIVACSPTNNALTKYRNNYELKKTRKTNNTYVYRYLKDENKYLLQNY